MSDQTNPYQSPDTAVVPEESLPQGYITEPMLLHLKKASPWLRFVGIAGFIFSGVAALTGGIFLPISARTFSSIPGLEEAGGLMTLFGGGAAIYTVGAAAFSFFMSLSIYRFGDRIRSYLATGMEQDLENAFRYNSRFWKMLGILFIIGLALVPVTLIVSVIVAMATVLG
ncbi:MAG: DUF5362 family protein [Treponema sp.]|nr:DUF5362 family protein [Treponema sp.]